MLAFLLQLNAWLVTGKVFLFALFMLGIWFLWLLRVIIASGYRPWTVPYAVTTSVIVPVVDEPEDLFRAVLDRIVEQRPTEVIVVINGPRNERWKRSARGRRALGVDRGRRQAQGGAGRRGHGHRRDRGAGRLRHGLDPDTLTELVKPFRDPTVGGVTTRQRILDPGRSMLTRWADWLENVRNEYSMPAMSVLGTVGCLPGRTIAFRRSILVSTAWTGS